MATTKTTTGPVKKIQSDDSQFNLFQSWLKTTIGQINTSIATLTSAANGGVTSVTATAPITSSGGQTPNIALTTPVTVANGGTGAAMFTAHGVLLGEGTSAVSVATIGTAGRIFTDNGSGADPSFQAPVVTAANFVQSSTVNNSGTTTVSATTGNIAKKRTGYVQVTGSCAGTTAAGDTITATLVRDLAGTPTTLATQTVATNNQFTVFAYNVSFSWVDTLPDSSNHTYSIKLAGSQNNTVAANQALIVAVEL